MGKTALIFYGGWDGHQPELVSNRFAGILRKHGYTVTVTDSQDCLADLEALKKLDLIVPCWTGGEISWDYVRNISAAVGSGVGMAGCHGGMCDAFHDNCEWKFITGGTWVSHPGGDGVEYTVNIHRGTSPIIEGIEDFPVKSEHYYLHVDPAVEVLASTAFPNVPFYHAANKPIHMPVIWTKYWGNGRVFYNSLGHQDEIFDKFKSAELLMERGMLWAGEGKQYAIDNNLDTSRYESTAKMF